MSKINREAKETLDAKPNIPVKNKTTADDWNETWSAINDNHNVASAAVSGEQGDVTISESSPTVNGKYNPVDEGTYTNILDNTATPLTYFPSTTDKGFDVTFLLFDGVWTKNAVDLGVETDVTPTLGSTNLIESNAVALIKRDVDSIIETISETPSLSQYFEGYLTNLGAGYAATDWNRSSSYNASIIYAYDEEKDYFYTGEIIDVDTSTAAGVVYLNAALSVIGYQFTDLQTYTKEKLSPPALTAHIATCSYGVEPIITIEYKAVKGLTATQIKADSNQTLSNDNKGRLDDIDADLTQKGQAITNVVEVADNSKKELAEILTTDFTEETLDSYFEGYLNSLGNGYAETGWNRGATSDLSKIHKRDLNKTYYYSGELIDVNTSTAVGVLFLDVNLNVLGYQFAEKRVYNKELIEFPSDDAIYFTTSSYGVVPTITIESKAIKGLTEVTKSLSVVVNTKEEVTELGSYFNGYYFNAQGQGIALAGWYRGATSTDDKRYTINKNNDYYFSGELEAISGDTPVGVLFLDASGNFIGYQFEELKVYNKEKIVFPNSAVYFTTSGFGAIPTITVKYTERINDGLVTSNIFEETNTWHGTSIPHSSEHPKKVAEELGFNLYKRAQGSSIVRSSQPMTASYYYGGTFNGKLSRLSETLAEKEFIINNYATIYPNLTGGSLPTPTEVANNTVPSNFSYHPFDPNTGAADIIRYWSYEHNIINEFLDDTHDDFITFPDTMIFEHGYNDLKTKDQAQLDYIKLLNTRNVGNAEYDAAVLTSRDRTTYVTAMNYILEKIYEKNPRQKIVFVSHYSRYNAGYLVDVQTELAKYWGIKLFLICDDLQITDQVAVGSQSLWATSPYSSYTSGQDTNSDMTILNLKVPDRIHPHTDNSGKTEQELADSIVRFLKVY